MNKFGTFVGGALLGAAVGTGVALFMAPKSGQELRKDVRGKYDSTFADVQSRAQETRSLLEAQANETRAKLETQLEGARSALNERKTRIVTAAKSLREPKNDKVESVAA